MGSLSHPTVLMDAVDGCQQGSRLVALADGCQQSSRHFAVKGVRNETGNETYIMKVDSCVQMTVAL